MVVLCIAELSYLCDVTYGLGTTSDMIPEFRARSEILALLGVAPKAK